MLLSVVALLSQGAGLAGRDCHKLPRSEENDPRGSLGGGIDGRQGGPRRQFKGTAAAVPLFLSTFSCTLSVPMIYQYIEIPYAAVSSNCLYPRGSLSFSSQVRGRLGGAVFFCFSSVKFFVLQNPHATVELLY